MNVYTDADDTPLAYIEQGRCRTWHGAQIEAEQLNLQNLHCTSSPKCEIRSFGQILPIPIIPRYRNLVGD
jgi:hypothetical protein